MPTPPPELSPEMHRALGAGLYNRCWDLMEIEDRTLDQDDELIATAHASAWHWLQVGHAANRVARATGCAPASTPSSGARSRRCTTRAGASRSSRPAARASRTGTRPAPTRRWPGHSPSPATSPRRGVEGQGLGRAVGDRGAGGPDVHRRRPRDPPRLTPAGMRPCPDARSEAGRPALEPGHGLAVLPRRGHARSTGSGYAHLWTWDHLYAIFGDPYQPIFEGWASLAAAADGDRADPPRPARRRQHVPQSRASWPSSHRRSTTSRAAARSSASAAPGWSPSTRPTASTSGPASGSGSTGSTRRSAPAAPCSTASR